MKMLIIFLAGLLSTSPANIAFQKEVSSFQEEAESYYLLQCMIAREYVKKPELDRFSFSSMESIEFVETKDHDLFGWTSMEKDRVTGNHRGVCITPVYDLKKKKIGYLIGKYRFQTKLQESTILQIGNSRLPLLHEKLKYSHSLIILSGAASFS